jgi:hypothetical protein
MKSKTAFNYLLRFSMSLRDIYHNARYSGDDVKTLSESCNRIIAKAKEKKVPKWVIAELFSLKKFLFHQLQDEVIYLHQKSNGQFTDSYSDLSAKDQRRINNGEVKSYHHYKTLKKSYLKNCRKDNKQYYVMEYEIRDPFLCEKPSEQTS